MWQFESPGLLEAWCGVPECVGQEVENERFIEPSSWEGNACMLAIETEPPRNLCEM